MRPTTYHFRQGVDIGIGVMSDWGRLECRLSLSRPVLKDGISSVTRNQVAVTFLISYPSSNQNIETSFIFSSSTPFPPGNEGDMHGPASGPNDAQRRCPRPDKHY